MKLRLLLTAMMVKELRILLRERHQIIGLIVSIAVLVGVVGAMGYRVLRPAVRDAQRASAPTTQSATAPAADPPRLPGIMDGAEAELQRIQTTAMRWAAIMGAAGLGVFFSLGYLMAATLASFAGEKDSRTLEILLAAPLGDSTLFLAKCGSILLPMSAIAYVFVLIPTLVAMAFFWRELAQAPISVPLHVLVLSIPVLVLAQAVVVGIGAAISSRAETLKGASQVFGAVTFILIFGGAYGLPLLVQHTPLKPHAINLAKRWLELPFVAQYLALLAMLAIPAIVAVAAGRAIFRRDRLLA